MPDLLTETLIPLRDVPSLPMFATRKKRLGSTTAANWAKGIRGAKLDTRLIGGVRHTSVEELHRFIRAINNLPQPDTRVRLLPATLAEIDPD